MIARESIALVDAVVAAELEAERDRSSREERLRTRTVTIARDCGAGGARIAASLARALGVKCYDRELLDAVARDGRLERRLMERLDERPTSPLADWSFSIVWGHDAMREDYARHLRNVAHAIAASTGGVIVGRGVNFVLGPDHAFRVRVCGSPGRCARRLALERGIPVEDAARIVRETNADRDRFIRDTYGREWTDPTAYDLVVNTDRFDEDRAARIILAAMAEADFA